MSVSWSILWLGCVSFCLAALVRSATESTTTAAPKTTHETPAVDLGALLDAGEGAVVTLVAGDARLAAHRAVLAARSPSFKAALSNSTVDASSGQLHLSDLEGPVLRQLLAYLYTLQAPQVSSTAPQLLAAADRYGVPGLQAVSERELVAQLAVDNAVLAVRHSCPRLREAAVAFIRANFFSVVASQAWGRALLSHAEDMAGVVQLLAEPPAGTSTPAAADSETDPGLARSGSSQTPAASTPAPPACTAFLPGDDTVSRYRSLYEGERDRRLKEAAQQGAVGEVAALLAAGAHVRSKFESDWTALHHAAFWGRVDVVRCLLDAGARVNARDSWKNTPLHHAAYWGHTAVVRLLTAASANLRAKNKFGRTPLHHAALGDRAEVAAVLLEAGADRAVRDNRGKTPLDLATKQQVRQLLTGS